ncbi:MAG: Fe-S-cluster-containing dehydrogenase component, partial [Candidatus Promineifilaceae bacterium]
FDPTGIQSMLLDMFLDIDPALNEEAIETLTEDLELHRLENIIHLSQQGDGWDSATARAAMKENVGELLTPGVTRREAIKMIAAGLLAGFGMLQSGCAPGETPVKDDANLKWDEHFKGNFRLMSDDEKTATVDRLERLYEEKTGKTVNISAAGPLPGVLYGYAFNISKCRGYMDCVRGCLEENNQDRASDMKYIRIHEHKQGQLNFDEAVDDFYHQVPAEDRFYIGTQCFHCENAPCIPVCPVKATWKEDDGIVVVDYDWCIGCRYCIAACPYDARRFNWSDPVIPEEEINGNQHYLGNRVRKQGVTEKCTFCIQRTRTGKNPACVEACPTGARVFGNLLDPNSDIRWVLKNKKVFRLKEDLGTEPKFWYFMD